MEITINKNIEFIGNEWKSYGTCPVTTIWQNKKLQTKQDWYSKLEVTEIQQKINDKIQQKESPTGIARVETPQVEALQV